MLWLYLAPMIAVFWRSMPRSTSRYPAAGSVDSAIRKPVSDRDARQTIEDLTTEEHGSTQQCAVICLEPFKKRYQCKCVEERVEEAAVDERVGIESVHCCGAQL